VLTTLLLRSPTALLAEQRGALNAPAGSAYGTSERFGVSTAAIGDARAFKGLFSTQMLRVTAEIGGTHVSGLPDPMVKRFGRAIAYGSAPDVSNGTLTPGCGVVGAAAPAAFA